MRDPFKYARAALEAECAELSSTGHGRNGQVNTCGFKLGQFIPGGYLPRHEIEHCIEAAAHASGYVRKDGIAAVRASMRSGIEAGMKQPRDLGLGEVPIATVHILRPKPKLSDVELPEWTEPEADGKPKFIGIGQAEPRPFGDEARRHVYMRDGTSVRVKTKNQEGRFTNWFKVRRPSDGAIGWQARKPVGWVDVPYVPPGAPNPFDPSRRGETIAWPEGEKDADTLATRRWLAFTLGGTSDIPDMTGLLDGHHVLILADNDKPGEDAIPKKIAAAIQAGAASVKVCRFPELPEGGDVSDYYAAGGDDEGLLDRAEKIDPLTWKVGAEAEAFNASGASGTSRPDAQEKPAVVNDRGLLMGAFRDRLDIALRPEKAPAYPVEALPTLMADMVGAMADLVQAPDTLCAHAVLSAAVLVTQGLADIHLPNTSRAMPLSLFLLVVAASGERKSSCDGLALKAVAQLEARLSETYADEMRTFRADRAAYEGEVSKIKADRKIEQDERKQKLRALYEPEEPTAPIIRATEPNLEGLLNLIAKGRPSLGVFTAEGGSFLGGHGMNEDAKTRTLTGLSTLYDTGSAQRVRAKEITILDGRRVSISLAAQAKIAAALLGDELAQDQGFLGRFLVCYPDSRIGTREVRLSPTSKDARVEAFTDRVQRLLSHQDGIKAPLRLPVLEIDDEAWEVFRAFSQAIEDNLGDGKHWHPIRAAAQRMAENVGRIAGVLHLFAHGGTDKPVDGDTMVSACEVGAFYLKEALRISGGVMVDADTQAVADLATWIESRPGDLIAPSIIQQFAPRPRANAAKTRERIRLLCEAGRLEAIGEGEIEGKHYREAYRINRLGKH